MKKFLLVLMIGMAVTMNVYGFVMNFMEDEVIEVDHVKETTTTVYME